MEKKINHNSMVESIIPYTYSGLACIPAKNKIPTASWRNYQYSKPPLSVFETDFNQVAVICGRISGNLEVIDIDNKWDKTGDVLNEYLSINDTFDLNLCINKSKNNGYHVFFRCDQIEGNKKLAQIQKGNRRETVVETRGEGGIIIVPPSDGYVTIRGSMVDIPTISTYYRDILHQTGMSFNETIDKPVYEYSSEGNGITERFNSLSNAGDLARASLERGGWKFGRRRGVRRPGKDFGISATWGYTKMPYMFYVFSSNAFPFEEHRAYSPYQIICLMDFGGNWKQMRAYAERLM